MQYLRGWIMSVSIMCVLCLMHATGEAAWQIQEPVSSKNLYGIHFVSRTQGWVVGEMGHVQHTNDGGRKWVEQSISAAHDLYDVCFVNSQTGWAVGDVGDIWQTTDGGITWLRQKSNVELPVYGTHFVAVSRGWAVGSLGSILHTKDGGKNWVLQPGGTSMALRDVCFVDENTGWVVGDNGTILHTTNGGTQWTRQDSGVNEILYGVTFVDAQQGWAVGDNGVILQTGDGGASWESLPTMTDATLYDVCFSGPRQGWAIGTQGKLLETTNGGSVWREANIGITNTIWSMSLAQTTLWCVGDAGFTLQRPDIPVVADSTSSRPTTESDLEHPQELVVRRGNLTVRSTPTGARIYLNGELQQERTPATLTELIPGRYEVKLAQKAHGVIRKTIYVNQDETSLVNAKLPSRNTMIGTFTGILTVTGIGLAIAIGLIK